ncbi:MAG: hypothetical protein U0L51_04845 [Olegusella sp.]|nr:hypothetical protein [Olegusella sp.]
MRPNTSLESGVCALLMMALQEGHASLASNVMADVLDMDKVEAGVVDWSAVASRKASGGKA